MQAITEEQGYRLDDDPMERTQSTSVGHLADMIDRYDDVTLFLDDVLAAGMPAVSSGASASSAGLGAIDKLVSDVISRLAILSQDTSAQLELAIHDVSRTVPRLTYDLQYMRESAGAVRQSLDSVQRGAGLRRPGGTVVSAKDAALLSTSDVSAQSQTQRVLDRMTHLDAIKTHMEDARHVLREAESWSSLEQETLAFIQAGVYDRAAERLAEAATSIQVFESAPAVYAARKELLVSLQDQLEARLRDQLTAAASGKQLPGATATEGPTVDRSTQLKDLHRTFVLIDRESDFQEAYCTARAQEPLARWKASSDSGSAIDSLPAFYAAVQHLVEEDIVLMPKIFSDPLRTLVSLLERIFDEVQPSFGDTMEKLADDRATPSLPRIISLWEGAVDFVKSIRGILGGLPRPPLVNRSSDDKGARPSDGLTRRTSRSGRVPGERRQSVAAALAPGNPAVPSPSREWEASLAKVFQPYQSTYGRLEQAYLLDQLRRDVFLPEAAADRAADLPRLLIDRTARLGGILTDAMTRCAAFTSDFGIVELRGAVDEAYRQCFFSMDRTVSNASEVRRRPDNPAGLQDELDDLGSLDYSNEDWASFQLGLNLLQSCRRLDDMLVDAEDSFGKRLVASEAVTSATGGEDSRAEVARSLLIGPGTSIGNRQQDLDRLKASRTERLLPSAAAAAQNFVRRRQESLQQIILAPLQSLLAAYAALPIFSQPEKVNRRSDIQIPTFSPSPTDTMAQVAEGLLNLIRLFEVYASDEGLSFSLETLPFIDQDGLAEVIAAHASAANDGKTHDSILPTSALLSTGTPKEEAPGKSPAAASPPPEIVLSSWVSSLALNLLSHLTTTVLPSLRTPVTRLGSLQLATDLAYLSNAIRALDVDWEELETWREGAECDGVDAMRDKLSRANRKNAGILSKIAQLRGWAS